MLKYTYFQEIHSFTEILLTFLMLLEQLLTSLLILSEDVNIKTLFLLLQHLLYIFVSLVDNIYFFTSPFGIHRHNIVSFMIISTQTTDALLLILTVHL